MKAKLGLAGAPSPPRHGKHNGQPHLAWSSCPGLHTMPRPDLEAKTICGHQRGALSLGFLTSCVRSTVKNLLLVEVQPLEQSQNPSQREIIGSTRDSAIKAHKNGPRSSSPPFLCCFTPNFLFKPREQEEEDWGKSGDEETLSPLIRYLKQSPQPASWIDRTCSLVWFPLWPSVV